MIDQFILDSVFYRIDLEDGETVYWREAKEGREGYILYFPSDNNHHHTYWHPDRIYEGVQT